MTESDRTLAAIDDAIDGYVGRDSSVSPDAMRWAPEPPQIPDPRRTPRFAAQGTGHWAPAGTSPTDSGWQDLGTVTSPRVVRPAQAQLSVVLTQSVEQFRSSLEQVADRIRVVFTQMAEFSRTGHVVYAPLIYGDDYRRHRRRCALCNPAGNPKPLAVDGHEYHRRTCARRRRNRR